MRAQSIVAKEMSSAFSGFTVDVVFVAMEAVPIVHEIGRGNYVVCVCACVVVR